MKDNSISFNNSSYPSSSISSNSYQSTFLLKGNNLHFKISNLYDDFEQDELATKEFVEVAITDLTKLKIEIFAAIHKNDLVIYKQAHYRTLTTLKMIQADTLQGLLEEVADFMKLGKNVPEEVVFRNLEEEFSAVLACLSELNLV